MRYRPGWHFQDNLKSGGFGRCLQQTDCPWWRTLPESDVRQFWPLPQNRSVRQNSRSGQPLRAFAVNSTSRVGLNVITEYNKLNLIAGLLDFFQQVHFAAGLYRLADFTILQVEYRLKLFANFRLINKFCAVGRAGLLAEQEKNNESSSAWAKSSRRSPASLGMHERASSLVGVLSKLTYLKR
ncbi:MAG: hypothetical protein U5K69_10405 [Balneolaceae bacterium]|nr:hypothetical protein [Balneolaceae bacterium]